MAIDTVVVNCWVVSHEGILPLGVAIDGGKVVRIAPDKELPPAVSTVDGRGQHLIPGVVDAHVHLEYPPGVDPKLNIQRESQACASAGCTTIVHLLAPSDDVLEKARGFVSLYEQNAFVDLALSARIYTKEDVKKIRDLYDYGIISVKLLLPYKGSEAVWKGLDGGVADDIVSLTFKEVARLRKDGLRSFVRVHCEDADMVLDAKNRFLQQDAEPRSWNEVRPRMCEAVSMQKCLALARETECPIYIVHMTIREGVALIEKAKAVGVQVVAETCIQYLTLNTENSDRVLSKVNPPIRDREDNLALWEAVREGGVDVVATDHAPVPKALKRSFWEATVGMPGAEMFLPLMLSEGVNKGRISLERLVEVCCYNPAKEYGLSPRKGIIREGSDADLVLIDLEKELPAPPRPRYSGSDFSLFEGRMIKGWPTMTMVGGRIVMDDGAVVGEPGCGRYVPGS